MGMRAEEIARATDCDIEIVEEEFRAAAYLAGVWDELYLRASSSLSSLRFINISALGPALQMAALGLSRESHEYDSISRRTRRQVCLSDSLKGRSPILNLPVRTICSRAVVQHWSLRVMVLRLRLERVRIW